MRIVASKKGDGTIEKELFSPESLKQNGVALTNGSGGGARPPRPGRGGGGGGAPPPGPAPPRGPPPLQGGFLAIFAKKGPFLPQK